MSFGWSVGDIFTAIEIIYEVSEALKSSTGSPEDRLRANQFLSTFDYTIKVVQQIYGPNLPVTPGSNLAQSQNEEDDTTVSPPTPQEVENLNALKQLYERFKEEIGGEYAGMNKNKVSGEKESGFWKRQAQKITWHFFAKKEIKDLRDKIVAQVQLLQPALAARQFQGVTLQAKLYHEESITNLDDIKNMIRVIYSHITSTSNNTNSLLAAIMANPAQQDPTSDTLSRSSTLLAGDPLDYAGYTTAAQQLAPFLPPATPETISISLRRLRVSHKLRLALKSWLTTLDSSSPSSNILWLLDHPVSTQCSAILYSVLSSQDRPVLAFSCSHVDPAHKTQDLSPELLLRNTLYSFLHTLLTYLDSHLPSVRQRIDAPAFATLDATPASIPLAITLLGNLLDNLPSPCVLIIDNMQHLDKSEIKAPLTELFSLFGRRPNRVFATMEGAHKLLLTTKGPCAVLADLTQQKRLSRLATKDQAVKEGGSGGYVLWEEVKSMVEGMAVMGEG